MEHSHEMKKAFSPNGIALNCPLCSSENLKNLETLAFKKISDAWFDYYQMKVKEYLPFEIDALQRLHCQNCGLTSFFPFPLTAPAELYIDLAKKNSTAYFPSEKWEFQKAINDLKGHSNVLEIGYGAGVFLKSATKAGIRIRGIELAAQSSENQSWNSLPVMQDSLESLAKKGSADFDGICSFQVLEHSGQPHTFIQYCCDLLKRGGTLILAVPNDESYVRKQFNLLNLPPHHVTRWVPKTFKFLEHLFPLRIETVMTEPLPATLTHEYLDANCQDNSWLRTLLRPSLRYQLGKFISQTGANKFLKGQSLYVRLRKL